MEDVHEALEGRVVDVALAFPGVFGEVQRQRPVGAGEAEEELVQARRRGGADVAHRGQGRRREGTVGLLPEAQRIVRQPHRMTEARQLRRLALDAPQRLEEVVVPGRRRHPGEQVQRFGRLPGFACHLITSPRSPVRSTVSVKLLIDT